MRLALRRDLGLQLLTIYLLFVIPVVIAALIFDRYTTQRIQQDIQVADLALARAIAEETNTTIENALLSVEDLATYPAVIDADPYQMLSIFEKVQSVRPDVNLIYRLGADGTMLFHYPVGGPNSTLGLDFSFRGYYQDALNSTEPLVSLGRISPTTSQPVATAVMPLWQDGEFIGLVATNIKLQSLSDTLASIISGHNPSESLQVIIIDAAGKVIAHPNQANLLDDMLAALPSVSQAVLSGASGNALAEAIDGVERLYSYVPVPNAEWGVIVSRPTAAAFATPRAFHQGILIVIGVFLVIGVFFWTALYLRIIRPLERVTAYSQRVGWRGEMQTLGVHPLAEDANRQDQLGHLARSFARMETSIQARFNELSTLLETSAAVVSTLKTRDVLENILEQVGRLMDIEKCAIVALEKTSGVFRAQASRGLSADHAEHLIFSPDEFHSVTMRAIRAGKPVQISDTETDPSYEVFRERARIEGYRSITALPLHTNLAPPSALVIYHSQAKAFSEREISLLASFANHAAMAIENATLFERSDAALQEQTRRLEALIQSFEDGLVLEDLRGRVLYINRRMSSYADKHPEDILGSSVESLFQAILANAKNRDKALTMLEKTLKHRAPNNGIELDLVRPSGIRHMRLKGFTVTDSSGLPIGRGQILRDTTKEYEVDRMKTSLISIASHELRTPLAAIKGYVSTLLAEDVSWDLETQHEFLEVISTEADRLSELVNNLLDMSRIEAGSLEITRKVCDINALISEAVDRCYPHPGERLQIVMPTDEPTIFADAQRLEVVIRNLIENATKYTEEGTPISLSVEVVDEQLIIRVEDEGQGIPLEKSEEVFSSFYRLDNNQTKKAAGAGLGLAICRGFVHAHDGKIWLEPKGMGTCVAFSIPVNGKLTGKATTHTDRIPSRDIIESSAK